MAEKSVLYSLICRSLAGARALAEETCQVKAATLRLQISKLTKEFKPHHTNYIIVTPRAGATTHFIGGQTRILKVEQDLMMD